MKKANLIFILLIIALNLLNWFKTTNLNFYNDDFQILSYLKNHFIANPFLIFSSKDISTYYFRPIPNFINTVILSIFDMNPLPFRLLSLMLHIILSISLYFFILKLFDNPRLALVPSLLFSLLPSHDVYIVWLASIGDLLAPTFILWSFYFLIKFNSKGTFLLSLLFFSLSLLSKESTLPAPCLAISMMFFLKSQRKRLIQFAVLSSSIILLIFLYRHFVLDINIFNSPNVNNFSLVKSLTNFFLYPFILVIPTFAFSKDNLLPVLFNLISILTFATFVTLYFFNRTQREKQVLVYGLAWYSWFVLPAIPLFMRWYSLLPSIGFFIVIPEFLKNIKQKYAVVVFVVFIAIFTAVNIYSLSGWVKANRLATSVLNASSKIPSTEQMGVLLWFFPEYYNNYPILRSGTHLAVNFARKTKFYEMLFPISTILKNDSKISIVGQDSMTFKFKIENARLFFNHRKNYLDLYSSIKNNYYKLYIENIDNDKIELSVIFLQRKPNFVNYYFNGRDFVFFF